MPEGKRHLELRTFLYQVLKLAFAKEASIGCDQFVYWNARDPRRCLAPDAFVYLGAPDTDFTSWKTWERGTPQLAVEIVSEGDRREGWEESLERYHELGVREFVRFDADAAAGARVRVWDRVDDDLVEREVTGDVTPCLPLGLFWVVGSSDGRDVLRLARDEAAKDLLVSPSERIAALEAEPARRKEG